MKISDGWEGEGWRGGGEVSAMGDGEPVEEGDERREESEEGEEEGRECGDGNGGVRKRKRAEIILIS